MATLIYGLCAVATFACAWLLFRSYAATRSRLLLWSGLCFVGLGLNNVLLLLDRVVFPAVDLSLVRLIPALIGMGLLLYGLIWEAE